MDKRIPRFNDGLSLSAEISSAPATVVAGHYAFVPLPAMHAPAYCFRSSSRLLALSQGRLLDGFRKDFRPF